MKVLMMAPLDWFYDSCIKVVDWLTSDDYYSSGDGVTRPDDRTAPWDLFLKACWAIMQTRPLDTLRNPPYVAYDAASDSAYFIFKEDNNGTTYLVGDFLPLGIEGEIIFDEHDKVPPRNRLKSPEIDQVSASIPIEVVIGRTVLLERYDETENLRGFCPFCKSGTTFKVSPSAGIFHCFACDSGGSVFNFIMRIHHCSFVNAVHHVRNMAKEYAAKS
jgi:hypothetical protein